MQAVKLAALPTAQEPKGHAVSKMACLIPNIPGLGDWACGGLPAWGSKRGIKVEVIAIDLGTFSARDVMTKAAAGRPDVIVMNFPKGILLPMMAAAQQLDWAKGIRFVAAASAYSADVANALRPYGKDCSFYVGNGKRHNANHSGPIAVFTGKTRAPLPGFASRPGPGQTQSSEGGVGVTTAAAGAGSEAIALSMGCTNRQWAGCR